MMTEVPLLVRAGVCGAAIAGLMVVRAVVMIEAWTAGRVAVMIAALIVVLAAGRTVRASGAVRC